VHNWEGGGVRSALDQNLYRIVLEKWRDQGFFDTLSFATPITVFHSIVSALNPNIIEKRTLNKVSHDVDVV
jgi:hypothetical protein